MREDDPRLERHPAFPQGTRSTLRLGPLTDRKAPIEVQEPQHILLLPLRLGNHRLVIEVARVIEIVSGPAWTGLADPERPVVNADLYRTLGILAPEDRETIVARADGQLGRGPGRFVAFSVDRAERLARIPLENMAPLPPVAKEQVQVDFLVGVARFQFPDDGMAFLVDPAKLADSATLSSSSSEEVP